MFEGHPRFPHVVARPMQGVFRVAVGGFEPYALRGQRFHAAYTQVFLAFAFFALVFGDQPAQRAVDAPVILHGRKLCRYEVSFGHFSFIFNYVGIPL